MRRLLRILLRALLVLVVLLVVVYLARRPLFERLIAGTIEDALAENVGGRWLVGGIEGSWFGDFVVVGLSTEVTPPEGALTRLDFGRARVAYDLLAFFDDPPIAAIRSVEVTRARVGLDLRRPSPEPSGEPFDLFDVLPPVLPRIAIDGAVVLETSEGTIELDDIRVESDGDHALTLAIGAVGLPERFGAGGALRGRVERHGDERISWTSQTAVSGVTVEQAAYTAAGDVRARLAVAGAPVDVEMGAGAARLETGDLDLARLPAWVRALAGPDLPQEGTVGATVDVTAFEPLRVRGDLRAAGVRRGDVVVTSARVKARWEDGRATVDEADVQSPDARVEARDVRVEPERPYFVAGVGLLKVAVPDLRAFVSGLDRRLAVEIDARTERAETLELARFLVTGDGIRLSGSGTATLPEDPERWREAALALAYEGSVEDLAVEEYRMRGAVTLEGTVGGTAGAPVARAEVAGADLVVQDRAVRRLHVVADVDWPRIAVEDLRVEAEAGTVVARGEVDAEAGAIREASYEIAVPDLGAFLALVPGAPPAAGSVEGSGRVATGDAGLEGTATLTVEGLAIDGEPVGDLDVDARVAGDEVTFRRLEGATPFGSFAATGLLRAGEGLARVDTLRAETELGPVALRAPAELRWGEDTVAASGLDVDVLGGRVRGSVKRAPDLLDADLHGEALDLAALRPDLEGRASFVARAVAGQVEVEVTAPSLRYRGYAGELYVRAVQDEIGIVVERLSLAAGKPLGVEGTASLPYRFDFAQGALVRTDGVTPAIDLTADVRDLDTFVSGVDAERVRVRVEGGPEGLRARIDATGLAPHPAIVFRGDTSAEVVAGPGSCVARIATERHEYGEVDAEIRSDRGLDWTRPEAWTALLERATLDGRVDVAVRDLSVVKQLTDAFVRIEGAARVQLEVKGPLRDPEVFGTATIERGVAKLPGDVPPFQDVEARLVLGGRRVDIERLDAQLGYAPLSVRGHATLPADGPPSVDATLKGTNVLLVRQRYLRLRADLDLRVSGPLDALLAEGNVTITDALFSRPMNLVQSGAASADNSFQLFSVREPPLSDMRLDVRIDASDTFRISNNVIRGALSFALELGGTAEVPVPEGRIDFRNTLVKLPLTSIKVDRGQLSFPPDSPFAPQLSASAHTRMRGYDLDITARGRVPDIELQVSTRPALPQDQALLLLTTGQTTLEGEGGRSVATGIGMFLGRSLAERIAGPSDPDERTLVDRFEFAVGREISRSGTETIEGEFELTRKWYLRGERDRFDDYNFGIVYRLRFR